MNTPMKSFVLIVSSVALLLVALATPNAASAQPTTEVGKVTTVTLYRGQALVTREIPLKAGQGAIEIVVGDLPERVVSDSLFAEGSPGIDVRAVRFRSQAVGEEPREEVRKLDEAIKEANEKAELLRKTQELLGKQTTYLDQLEGFVAPTAKTELSKGVLDAEALEKITTFSFQKREEILTKQVENEKETKALEEQLSLLQRKRAELTDGSSHNAREAVVFVEKEADAPESISLSYLVESCGWSPSYTFRAGADRAEVAVECNALIHQMTGEDWGGVELTLSTASPAISAAAPGLAPFPVSLKSTGEQQGEQQAQQAKQADLAVQAKSIRTRQQSAIMGFQNTLDLTSNIGANWDVNAAANDFQSLELVNPRAALQALKLDSEGPDDGPSLSYRLAAPVSLASRSDQQMVRILQTNLASTFHHIATPVLTSYVYREAKLTNTSEEDMLGGPITVYLNGSFVGRGEIPTVARGQTFVVGFGADPQLRARRELADRTDSVQGGNRELSFQYRLVVENYKDQPVNVSVFDRLPHTERAADVRINLDELEDALSDDKLYLRRERPKGIVRWDIEVAANAMGENARLIEYGYTVEFDRSFQLTAAASDSPEQRQEFEQLQRARLTQ
ncbi:MAG: mucoidy inhibitor MuiA family protein [Planctomycetes bacterium]|nr:mucoidy inhibitor MuiA family protein [Planctomycetota bacterium]MBL7039850.1 mucoidy inhibitor MuiA family protein [Pirellulaceae bacterium]